MALDYSKDYRIRNPSGRELDVPGDILALRALTGENDVVLEDGKEIPIRIYLISQENHPFSGPDLRDSVLAAHEQVVARDGVDDRLSHALTERALAARNQELNLAAQAQLVRATVREAGADERILAHLEAVDDFNSLRDLPAAPIPQDKYVGEPQPTPESVLASRNDEAADAVSQQLNEQEIEAVRRESPGSAESGLLISDEQPQPPIDEHPNPLDK